MESYAMNYSVRKATSGDIASLVRLADLSRQTMKRTGNASIFREDIASNDCYLVLSGRVAVGAFVLRKGPDPTYAEIFQGQWLDTAPYSVLHGVMSDPDYHGVFSCIIRFCREQCSHLRIDTYRDNAIMRHLVQKHGFAYCGIIHIADGTERLAFQWTDNSHKSSHPHQ